MYIYTKIYTCVMTAQKYTDYAYIMNIQMHQMHTVHAHSHANFTKSSNVSGTCECLQNRKSG